MVYRGKDKVKKVEEQRDNKKSNKETYLKGSMSNREVYVNEK